MKRFEALLIPEGWRYIAVTLVAAGVFALLDLELLSLAALAGAGALVWIYQQPGRTSAAGPGEILAPCDGTVTAVEATEAGTKVTIRTGCFQTSLLSAPCEGEVAAVRFEKGMALPEKSPLFEILNETAELTFVSAAGTAVRVRHQLLPGFAPLVIDGCENAKAAAGERYGVMVRGLTEIVLPENVSVTVAAGEKVFASQTRLGSDAE